MYKNNIDMRVLVNGRPVREYPHNGTQFIESRNGSNYTIRIKNDNAYRTMVAVSVDGLDVITGKPAEKSNKGYIVDAYSSTEIKGYRLSDTDSAAFVFVSKGKSYVANATGDSRNSGVIGIRVFEEKAEKIKVVEKHIHHYHQNPWNPYIAPTIYRPGTYVTSTSTSTSTSTFSTSTIFCAASGQGDVFANNSANGFLQSSGISTSAAGFSNSSKLCSNFDSPIQYTAFDTGTSFGQKQSDKIKKEYFRIGKMIGELVMYYASGDALLNMGIDLSDTAKISESVKVPKAFSDSEYCQPPKGWKG